MQGVPIVKYNDANIPLASSVDQWQRAYEWKLGMNSLQLDPAKMDQQRRLEASIKAKEAN